MAGRQVLTGLIVRATEDTGRFASVLSQKLTISAC